MNKFKAEIYLEKGSGKRVEKLKIRYYVDAVLMIVTPSFVVISLQSLFEKFSYIGLALTIGITAISIFSIVYYMVGSKKFLTNRIAGTLTIDTLEDKLIFECVDNKIEFIMSEFLNSKCEIIKVSIQGAFDELLIVNKNSCINYGGQTDIYSIALRCKDKAFMKELRDLGYKHTKVWSEVDSDFSTD